MSKYTTICHTLPSHEDIGALIECSPILKGVRPSSTTTHVYLSFVEVHQPCLSVNNLTNAEMAIILRVVEETIRSESQYQFTSFSSLLICCIKVNIHPFTILLILNLPCHRVHTGLNTKTTSYIHEEDITTATIGDTALPHTSWCLWDSHRTTIRVHADILSNPVYQ